MTQAERELLRLVVDEYRQHVSAEELAQAASYAGFEGTPIREDSFLGHAGQA